jgi:hypothetical protein
MDKIIRICLGLLTIILVAFAGLLTYTAYTEITYRNTLEGTYTYTCTITTDAPLYNVTLFIPVPVDPSGNSPMVSRFSNRMINGVPADWETTLFDTGKSTLLKVTTPVIPVPEGTTASHEYAITISSETTSRTPIDTRDPVNGSAMFRPVQNLHKIGCIGKWSPISKTAKQIGVMDFQEACSEYNTSIYADYETSPDTQVTIESTLHGRNTWTIFEQGSNEYYTGISIVLAGKQHGWAGPYGSLETGIGSYDVPGGF